jgi:hypothetical protein
MDSKQLEALRAIYQMFLAAATASKGHKPVCEVCDQLKLLPATTP